MKSAISRLFQWAGAQELVVLSALCIVFAGTWSFVELTDEVLEGDTQALDDRIFFALRSPEPPYEPIGSRRVRELAQEVTALGGYVVLALLTFGVAGFFGLARMYGAMWLVLISVCSGYALTMGLKSIFERPRPPMEFHDSYVTSMSFPSGHAMMSAVVYITLGTLLAKMTQLRALKLYFVIVAAFLAILIGCSRVYVGVHYPTDVLAGWTGGVTWATLCWLVARRLQRRGSVEQEI